MIFVRPRGTCRGVGVFVLGLLALLVPPLASVAGSDAAAPDSATDGGELSMPAVHVRDLALPGEGDLIERPCAIHVDRHFDEVLVGDPAHSRVVVFGLDGTYRHEFSVDAFASMPVDITVDPEGFVHVLGNTRDGVRLFRFDFDGLPLGEIPIARPGEQLDLRSLASDEQGRLYLVEQAGLRVLRCDRDGNRLGEFAVVAGLDEKTRSEVGLGTVSVCGDTVLVPVPMLGYVAVHDREGHDLGTIGHGGTTEGELAFPVAAEMTEDRMVLVLDKNRFNVLCFAPDGTFLGEFGGKGITPGWFYHPSLLAADREGLVYIGQIFQNRVQVCSVPEVIRTRHLRGLMQQGLTEETAAGGSGRAVGEAGHSARRSPNAPESSAPAAREGELRLTSRVLHRTGGPTQ